MRKLIGPVLVLLLALAGIALHSAPYYAGRQPILAGLNDFPAFYCGSRLLATHNLYDPAAMIALQDGLLGSHCETIQYVRLPFMAVMTWPLSRLPFKLAYVLWQLGCLTAMAIFIWLWPARRAISLLVCCWFPPVVAAFANGQDVQFLLLWACIGAWLVRRNACFAAGLVLSLCAAKFHLLVFLPVLLIAGRLWKLALGVAAGGAALLVVSFLAAGWNWPVEFYHTLLGPWIGHDLAGSSVVEALRRNLHGSLFTASIGVLAAAVAGAVWVTARRADFPLALAVVMAAGTLTAYHLYLQDYVMWLPLLTLAITRFLEAPAGGRNAGSPTRLADT